MIACMGRRGIGITIGNYANHLKVMDDKPLGLVVISLPTGLEALGSISGFAVGFFFSGELFHRKYSNRNKYWRTSKLIKSV